MHIPRNQTSSQVNPTWNGPLKPWTTGYKNGAIAQEEACVGPTVGSSQPRHDGFPKRWPKFQQQRQILHQKISTLISLTNSTQVTLFFGGKMAITVTITDDRWKNRSFMASDRKFERFRVITWAMKKGPLRSCLGYRGWNPTHLYSRYLINNEIKIPRKKNRIHWK